jgi:hypothetical protein
MVNLEDLFNEYLSIIGNEDKLDRVLDIYELIIKI